MDKENFAFFGKLLEYKCNTSTHQKKFFLNFLLECSMFKLNEKYEVDRASFKYDYDSYNPESLKNIDVHTTKRFIVVSRKDCDISAKDSFIELGSKEFITAILIKFISRLILL